MAWMDKITGAFKKMKDATSGKPVSEALPEMLPVGDPRTLIRPLGGDWLCPFSLTRVAAPSLSLPLNPKSSNSNPQT